MQTTTRSASQQFWTAIYAAAALVATASICAAQTQVPAQNLPAPFAKRLVAFYGSWSKYQTPSYSASQIPFDKLTHIIHAGINLNEPVDGSITVPATGYVEPALQARAGAAGVKIVLGVGAWSGEDYSILTANPSYRTRFIQDVKSIANKYHYAGVDIDWEYPNGPADARNLVKLVNEIRAAFPPSFIISMDIPNFPSDGVDFPHLIGPVTWFNIMMYDAAGPWTGDVQFNSPIFDDPNNPNDQGAADQAANDFLNVYKVPAYKINMGMPFYGYDYMDQSYLYENCDPCTDDNVPSYNYAPYIKNLINKNGWVRHRDPLQKVPYLVRADGSPGFITYDDETSTFLRVVYSIWERKLGGTFMWALDEDYDGHSQDLLEGMYRATLLGSSSH